MPNHGDDYDLDEEYDLSSMRIVEKGRYAPHRRAGKNVVLLAPDVMEAFPTDEAVNEALRLSMQIAKIPDKYKASVTR
ncbi:MAG: hypothetical protein ABFS56_26055 [Pseudomonadota bacterium]